MIKKTLLIVLTLALLQRCNVSGTWKNDHIESKERAAIKIMNDKLLSAIKSGDTTALKALMADKLIEKGVGELTRILPQLSKAAQSDNYKVLDEFNVHNAATGQTTSLPSTIDGNDYTISFTSLNKEMYVSLLTSERKKSELLTTAIYGKYGDDWKINILQFGQYTAFGKSAPDYYKLAKESYAKGFLVNAFDNIYVAKKILKPANAVLQFKAEKEINDFADKILAEIKSKYVFPLELGNIPTKPKILRIYPDLGDAGFYPMIMYLSTIDLKDEKALAKENDQVKKETAKIFTGINDENAIVFYKAFNEIPTAANASNFVFIDTVNVALIKKQ